MGLTKQQLEALNNNSFPNNNAGAITPAILRDYNDATIANTVNQDVYTTDSASFDSRIDGLATTSSLNAVSTSVGLLQTFSGSQYKADSASFSARILAVTGSGGNIDTSSFATTGSNTFIGGQTIEGNITFPSGSFISSTNVSGNLYLASLNGGLLQLNTDGGEGDVLVGSNGWSGKLKVRGDSEFTGSIIVSNSIKGTGSINLQPDQNDARLLEIYNTAATDTHITASGGNLFLGNDETFVLVTTYANQKEVTIRGDLGIHISGSITSSNDISTSANIYAANLTGSGGNVSVQEEGTILGDATSFNFLGAGVTATFSAGTASVTIAGGGGSTFPYTGSAIITGSLVVTGSITEKGDNIYLVNANQTLPFNITQSAGGTNLIFGWNGDSTTVAQSQLTGSFSITGSNNIILTGLILDENYSVDPGFRAYLSGSNNILYGQNSVFNGILINSSSVMLPKMDSNILGGYVNLGFTSSSLAKPTFSNNSILGGGATSIILTHPSGSVNMTGNLGNRGIVSNANKTTLDLLTTIQNNVFIGGAAPILNHNSSSIQYTGNIGAITVTNNLSSSTSTAVNNVTVQNNTFFGTSNSLLISGSNTTARRNINNNLVAGRSNTISSEYTGSSVGHLVSTAVIGQNLIVSASGTSTTVGGGAFFGRYNDETNMYADSGKMVFAVGTGTGTSARKTALSVDSSSVVNVSGSLSVTGSATFIGNSNFNGNMVITGSLTASSTINGININNGDVTASAFFGTGNKSFAYQAASSGGVINTFNTALGRDYLDIYQYQGQAYAFNMHLTSDQLNTYSGSQFAFQLQTNGSGVSIPGGGATYFAMVSASYSSSVGPGTEIPGLDVLGSALFLDMKAPSTFKQKVYLDKGLYVSASAGTSGPALTINTNGGTALKATGSVIITGSLQLNGNNLATTSTNTFGGDQIVSASIYIAPNNNSNQLYLPSGSNKQTGIATLDGGNPGAVTVSNSQVTANSIIMLTKQTLTNAHMVAVSSKGSGTFTITSNGNGDTDVVAFMIINPS